MGPPPQPPARPPLKLTILHTNDHHGRFWRNSDGEYGLAARKTLIDQVRKEVAAQGGHTLLLDGGVPRAAVVEGSPAVNVVEFSSDGTELWGPQAEPGTCVSVDAWEPYLEAA